MMVCFCSCVRFKGRVPYDPDQYAEGMYPALTNQEQEDNAVISEMQSKLYSLERRESKLRSVLCKGEKNDLRVKDEVKGCVIGIYLH